MKRLLLLLNMGGPNDLSEVKVFLKNMFNDPCILGIKNSVLRKFVAFMITNSRLKSAQENYRQIGGKSPICDITNRLCKRIKDLSDEFEAVDFAMNYTPPFAKDVLKKYENFDEIVVMPLYPHHSVTTVVSSLSDFQKAFKSLNLKAKVRVIEPFYKDESFNELIVKDIKNKVKDLKTQNITLIFSSHSLPQKIIQNGDLYEEHTKEHVQILSDLIKKEMNFKEIRLAYQSRLGPIKWLEPALSDELEKIENKNVLIYPISFCIDNSETVFELVKEYKELADELKFSYYDVVACPNDSEDFAKFIIKIASK
ncbi:ferrochelatase [Campylobacter sp.]|uniref:ferrochelatase n=1 Tax=Campylobacter sp. TaxID=205 RepID=UPI00270C48AD|nr:ferrochelatase [Campylobacter sp.]